MDAFFGLLSFLLIIALIIGLIKPRIILRWDNKPTRLKVFGYWVLAFVLIGIIGVATTSDADIAQANIESATSKIESKNYEDAISILNSIKEDNKLYTQARQLIVKVDSLKSISDEEEKIAKEEAERLKAEEDKIRQKEQLERELKSLSDGVDFSTYRGSIDNLQMELVLFSTWADIIRKAENSADKEVISLAKKLKSKVSRIQTKQFPILRKEYAKVVADKMWESDINVYSSGSGHTRINFTGGLFAANKNKKDFQEQLHEILTMFRFSQSRYRWYKGQDEYTYYKIESPKDSELVDFSN
jgi:hypothetical protein